MAKTLKGFGGGNVIEIKVMLVARSTPFAMLTRLCASRIPEEIEEGQGDAKTGHRFNYNTPEGCR
jgi:hypothetical protein